MHSAVMSDNEPMLDPDELLALARRDVEAGRLEEALRKLKALIAEPDVVIDALPFAARVYAQLGLTDRARTCYRRYLQARPDATLESFELGMTYFERGDNAEAGKLWHAVLERAPTHPPALFYRALLAAREGRMPEARRDLDVLLQAVPTDNLYVARGRELLQEIDSQQAAH
jgi:tetratricopeptide (TPR) repeat protein